MEQIRQVYDYKSSNEKYIFRIIKELQVKKFKVVVYKKRKQMNKTIYSYIKEESYPTELDCILRIEELDKYDIILDKRNSKGTK